MEKKQKNILFIVLAIIVASIIIVLSISLIGGNGLFNNNNINNGGIVNNGGDNGGGTNDGGSNNGGGANGGVTNPPVMSTCPIWEDGVHRWGIVSHTKEYEATPATCEQASSYYISCSCGEKGTDIYPGEYAVHDYVNGFCKWCGDKEHSSYLSFYLTDDDLGYKVGKSKNATIDNPNMVIPRTYCGLPVVEIINDAFYGLKIERVEMLGNVKIIGQRAFRNCSSLVSVEIPETIEYLGYRAFAGCSNLKRNQKNGINYLGNSTNKYLCIENSYDDYLEEAIIDPNCRVIGEAAFSTAWIKKITFAQNGNLISLGQQCFEWCNSLTEVKIPSTVKYVADAVFVQCDNLEKLYIPSSVTKVGEGIVDYDHDTISRLTIYCEVAEKPDGWHEEWVTQNHRVNWNSRF